MVEIIIDFVSTLNSACKRLSTTHQLLLRWLFKTGLHAKPAYLLGVLHLESKMMQIMQTQTGRSANKWFLSSILMQLQIDSTVQRRCTDAHGQGGLPTVAHDSALGHLPMDLLDLP